MSSGIFISYRRDDTRHVAGRLAGDLADRFGEAAVFRDVDSIGAGLDFTTQLEDALSRCAVMLVLIGPQWLPLLQRRLDQPQDWVRQEVAAALQRGVRVVPVLVEDTKLPAEADLPPDLKPLVNRQARSLSDERWRGDSMVLMDMLAKLPGIQAAAPAAVAPSSPSVGAPAPAAKAASSRLPMLAAVALVVLGGGGYVISKLNPPPAEAATAAEAQLAQNPPAAGPAAPAVDISGNWRSGDSWTYFITQPGPDGTVAIQHKGEDSGKGTTRVVDNDVKLTLHFPEGNDTRSDECDLKLSEDHQTMSGTCTRTGTDAKGSSFEPYTYTMRR